MAAASAIALAGYVQHHAAGGPFDWARRNCFHFVAGWVRLATGRDVLAGLPPCASATAWVRQVRRAGGAAALVTQQLRCQPIAPALARLGDVVLLPGDVTDGMLAICNGRTSIGICADGASSFMPTAAALHAWRLDEVAA